MTFEFLLQAEMGHQVIQVLLDLKERKVYKDLKGALALMVKRENLVLMDWKVLLEQKVLKGKEEFRVPQV